MWSISICCVHCYGSRCALEACAIPFSDRATPAGATRQRCGRVLILEGVRRWAHLGAAWRGYRGYNEAFAVGTLIGK